jgi:hypothetical protein
VEQYLSEDEGNRKAFPKAFPRLEKLKRKTINRFKKLGLKLSTAFQKQSK